MLKVEEISEYIRVSGYAEGSDWLLLPPRKPDRGYGVAGEHVWTLDATGRLELFDATARRHRTSVELGEFPYLVARVPLTVSRDGRRLFVLRAVSPTESQLNIVEVASGEMTAHDGLPGDALPAPLERPDGRLLVATRHASLILVDPATGAREESELPGSPTVVGFLGASPDGRYWIRFDQASLPTREDSPGLIGRFLGKEKVECRYGLTVQLWEAFPLRFLRRMVVAWLTVRELPNETDLARMKMRPAVLPSRRVLWEMIAAATASVSDVPPGTAPPRSAYPADVASDDAAWQVIEKNVAALARQVVRVVAWQPDQAAFWINTNSFLSCAGIDGTISPRLYLERCGLEGGTVRPVAAHYREVVPLADRKASVIYSNGEALFDGAPSKAPDRVVAIPLNRDQWQARGGADDPEARVRSAAARRIEELKADRSTIIVPLAGWSEAECVRAIDELTDLVAKGEVHRRAVGEYARIARIVFEVSGKRVPESQFFPEVGARFPGTAPALRRLVDRYVDASGDNFLFADEQGPGVLAHAVKVLGVRDRAALPTLRRYGLLVDAEHEYFFAGDTVPAVVAAHGWTDEIIDFVFWVLVRNYYNTLQDYGEIWRSWGLRDAVVRRDPRVLARHLASELAEIIRWKDDPGRYGTGGLDRLALEIPQPHEPWTKAFFDELERSLSTANTPLDDIR